MADRPLRKAIRIEADLYYEAVSLAGKTRDGTPTALCRRLLKKAIAEAEERQAEKEEGAP